MTRMGDVKDFTDAHVPSVEPERLEIEHRIATEPQFRGAIYEQIASRLRELTVDQPIQGSLPIDIAVEVDQVSIGWVDEVAEAPGFVSEAIRRGLVGRIDSRGDCRPRSASA